MDDNTKKMWVSFGIASVCLVFIQYVALPYQLPWWAWVCALIGCGAGVILGFAYLHDAREPIRKRKQKEKARKLEREKQEERAERNARKKAIYRENRNREEHIKRKTAVNRRESDHGIIPNLQQIRITANRLWKCPKCGKVLKKGSLGTVFLPDEFAEAIEGTATCGGCGKGFSQQEVYSGKYDIELHLAQNKIAGFEGEVSVLVFRLLSHVPPDNSNEICRNALFQRYPKATLAMFYIAGRSDKISPQEAFIQYNEYVQEGQLPDLGMQFDCLESEDITGTAIVVLYFKRK